MVRKNKKTLLVISPGKNTPWGDCVYDLLVAETGEHLATHVCSGPGFALGDLYKNQPDRKEEISQKFGDVEVKFIDETELTEKELLKRNKEWFLSIS